MRTYGIGCTYGRLDRHRRHVCAIALGMILALLTLLTVSGPHLVHHLTEQHPQEHHHTQDGHPTPADHTPPHPDCLVLFLMQHTPVAGDRGALHPILLLAAESVTSLCPLEQTDAPSSVVQARTPPAALPSKHGTYIPSSIACCRSMATLSKTSFPSLCKDIHD